MRDFLELTKPRITVLILICTAVRYFFASRSSFHLSILGHVLLGTVLMACGTSALHQWCGGDSDAKMHRTREGPLAAGRMERGHRFVFCALVYRAGFAHLW